MDIPRVIQGLLGNTVYITKPNPSMARLRRLFEQKRKVQYVDTLLHNII